MAGSTASTTSIGNLNSVYYVTFSQWKIISTKIKAAVAAGGNDIGKCDVTEEELGLSDDSTKKITVSRLDDFRIQETVINDIAANNTDDVNPVTAKAVVSYVSAAQVATVSDLSNNKTSSSPASVSGVVGYVSNYTYSKTAIDSAIASASGSTYAFSVSSNTILNFNNTKTGITDPLVNALTSEDSRLIFSQTSGEKNIKISVVYPPIFDLVGSN